LNAPDDLNLIDQFEASAKVTKTACGPGQTMIWRRWGEGPALVLMHGGAGGWMHWIRNIGHLSSRHEVWAPDMPGFGDSDAPVGPLDADTIAPLVAAGLREVLKGRPFDLVGFSFGGLVSALMAAEGLEGLQRLVLVSVAGMGLPPPSLALKPMRGVTDPAEREAILRFNLNALMLHDPASIDRLALAVQAYSTSRERSRNRTMVLTDVLLALSARWRCDAYGIWSKNDALYREQPDRLVETSARLGLRDRIFLADAGHWLQYEAPGEFHAALERFLGEPVTHKAT